MVEQKSRLESERLQLQDACTHEKKEDTSLINYVKCSACGRTLHV